MHHIFHIWNHFNWAALLLGLVIVLVGRDSLAQNSPSVTVGWNANPDPDVVGYRVYYGTMSGQYSQEIDAGNTTSATVSGLNAGSTYYFAVTAYDIDGVESLRSAEISDSVAGSAPGVPPGAISAMQLLRDKTMQLTFTLGSAVQSGQSAASPSGQSAYTFQTVDVQFSNDLITWNVLETVPYTTGTITFVDSGASGMPRRFYRLVFH